MIDIVKVIHKQIKIFNKKEKCGFCWEFEAPMRLSDLNESEKKNDDCCVRVFLTDLRIQKNRRYPSASPYWHNEKTNTYSFNLHLYMYDRVDLNVYKEQAGHPLRESKWIKILRPLMKCFDEFDFCKLTGKQLRYDAEIWDPQIDVFNSNYTGWIINYRLTELIE